LVPTIHNPTTATMPLSRREEVAEILRRNDVLLLEDDAYGALEPDAVPLSTLIPERTYFMASLSKCIAQGLRVSFVLTPGHTSAELLAAAPRASVQMPTPLTVALVTRWLQDGSANAIIRAIRAEAAARQKLAASVFARHSYNAHPNGHHIWIRLPGDWTSTAFASHVQSRGLAVVTSEPFTVDGVPPHAVRISLGAASSRSDLIRALDAVAAALRR
jgi:DNA-binding transcriptional MocR family regulator